MAYAREDQEPSLSIGAHTRHRTIKAATWRVALAAPLCAVAMSGPACAGDHQGWKDVGNIGVGVLAASALVAAPLAHEDWQGFREALYSGAAAEGVTLLGKAVIHEERPNHKDHHSFPSGHTALSFAAATTMELRYGWQWGLPAYAGATLVGISRVAAREHHWWDVVAGAGVGMASGWLFTHPFDKQVVLLPWVGHKSGGVILAARF